MLLPPYERSDKVLLERLEMFYQKAHENKRKLNFLEYTVQKVMFYLKGCKTDLNLFKYY